MGTSFSSFEVEGECRSKNATLNCGIKWGQDGNGTTVTSLGAFDYGDFEANGDLAGIGTLLAFIIPTTLSLLIGLIMICGMGAHRSRGKKGALSRITPSPHGRARQRRRPAPTFVDKPTDISDTKNEQWYDTFETLLLATSDSQIVLGIALCINFALVGKCSISMYHFQMGLNILVITCANALLTLVLIRDYWRAPLSAIMRIAAFGSVLYFLGAVMGVLHRGQTTVGSPERLPPIERNNSLILLEAACFMDPDPLRRLNETISESPDRVQAVGGFEHGSLWAPERVFWLFLVFFSVMALVYRFIHLFHTFSSPRDDIAYNSLNNKGKKRGPFNMANLRLGVCWMTWILCVVIVFFQGIYLFQLREWVFHSGWLKSDEYKGNEEAHPGSFGQLAALFAMSGMVMVFFDQLTLPGRK